MYMTSIVKTNRTPSFNESTYYSLSRSHIYCLQLLAKFRGCIRGSNTTLAKVLINTY